MSRAFDRIAVLYSYAQALSHFETTAPIRGRSPELRPLASRRDADRFHIRTAANPLQPDAKPSIECVLYKTPVVTFHPDNTISITTGTHYAPSSSTANFIHNVLYGLLRASYQGGRIVLTITSPDDTGTPVTRKYSLNAGCTLTFQFTDRVGLTPVDPTPQTTITIDRASANNVRKRYGEFYRYLKATISLRSQLTPRAYTPNLKHIPIRLSEFKENLPVAAANPPHSHYWAFAVPHGFDITRKPAVNSANHVTWRTNVSNFLSNLQNGAAPEDEQPVQFYRAFLTLAYWARFEHQQAFKNDGAELERTYNISPTALLSLFDELLFKFHSNEVFTTRPVKEGQAPGTKFLKWIDWNSNVF